MKVDDWNLNYKRRKPKKKINHKINNSSIDDEKIRQKMKDLKNIYGVDAKALSNYNRVKQPAGTSMLKGSNKDGLGDSRYSDNSFRSTQGTFMKKMNSPMSKNLMSKASAGGGDNQSNLFSSGGFAMGKSKRWNDIESTLKGQRQNDLLQSQASDLTNSNRNFASVQKKLPLSGQKKLTST